MDNQKYVLKPDSEITKLYNLDPEFMSVFSNFAYGQVINEENQTLDTKTRYIAIIASLLGIQSLEMFKEVVISAMDKDVDPVEIKEIIYQAVAYLGMGNVLPFLSAINTILETKGVSLPLEGQSTTNWNTRLEKGIEAQVAIFGEEYKDFYKSGSTDRQHIQQWITSNCFGDYYTRGGLDYQQRELITFCFLSALGVESQLKSHIKANIRIGNRKEFLISVVSQCIPYIGYPKSLNTLRCITETLEDLTE